VQSYKITLKDDDGQIYSYVYHKFQENPDGSLMIYRAGGLTGDGTREMVLVSKFKNYGAILEIEEVEDEIEG